MKFTIGEHTIEPTINLHLKQRSDGSVDVIGSGMVDGRKDARYLVTFNDNGTITRADSAEMDGLKSDLDGRIKLSDK